MHGILNNGNVVFLEIFHFSKETHLCWTFRRILPLVILKRAVCGSICLCSIDGMLLSRQNRISWRKTCYIVSFFFFTTNRTRTGLVLNPILNGMMPATNNPGNRAALSLNLI